MTVAETNIKGRMTNVFQRENAQINRVLGGDDALLDKIDLRMMPVSLASAVHDAEVELASCSS